MSYQIRPNPVKSTWDASRLGWLGCAWFEKFGPASLVKLQKNFTQDGGMGAWEASEQALVAAGIVPATAKEFISWKKDRKLEDLKAKLATNSLDFILPWDQLYPSVFHQISSPPGALFWRGGSLGAGPWIAVVGTRKMSVYGKQATKKIVTELVELGAGIVSGLALGVDGMAHQTALDAGGKTCAILGSGIDTDSIYPRAHQSLAEQILISGGVLFSEYPPGSGGQRFHFPQRNRLIAALAQATVVVEADEKSGSVITAKCALDENRDVFAVPGPITSANSAGTHQLLKQGAGVCTCGKDVLGDARSDVQVTAEAASIQAQSLSMDELKILDLCRTAIHLDDLARLLSLPPGYVASTCLNLELKQAIQTVGPGQYELSIQGKRYLSEQAPK